MREHFTFTLSASEVDALMWLVEGNSAYEDLAEVLRVQIDSQED